MNKSDKVYVAGHTGMVGSAIVRKLQDEGFSNILVRSSKELDLRNQHLVEDFFQSENPMRKKVSKRYGSELVQDQQIEVLGQGQCVVTHNIHPATNQLYLWPHIDLVNCTLDSLPKINQSQVNQIISAAEEIMSSAGLVSKQDIKTRDKIAFNTMKHSGYDEISSEQMQDMLKHIPNYDRHYDDWLRICFALNAWGGDRAAELFDEWSAKSPKNDKAFT